LRTPPLTCSISIREGEAEKEISWEETKSSSSKSTRTVVVMDTDWHKAVP